MSNWISRATEVEFLCWSKMSPVNVTLVPLMWPRGAERKRQTQAWLIKRVAVLVFQPTHFPCLTNSLVCDMKWNFVALNYEAREFKHGLVLFGRRPMRSMWVFACVHASKWHAQTPRVIGPFMWTARTLFIWENSMALPTFMSASAVYKPASFIKASLI